MHRHVRAPSMKGLPLVDVVSTSNGALALAGMGSMRCGYCDSQPIVARCGRSARHLILHYLYNMVRIWRA